MLQAQLSGVTPSNMMYSNVIRMYIEENVTNTDRIDAKEIKIADDGKSLKLFNISQPVLRRVKKGLKKSPIILMDIQN